MHYYNVQAYGLIDTPANTTAAIHAAIAAAAANNGGLIYFPQGVYEHNGIVCRHPNVSFHGEFNGSYLFGDIDQPGGTILKYVGPVGGNAVEFGLDSVNPGTDIIYGVGIHDLTIDGGGLAGTGLRINGCYNSAWVNITIRGNTYSALTCWSKDVPGTTEDRLNYRNYFRQIYCHAKNDCRGILLLNGVAFLGFHDCHVTHENKEAYNLHHCDDCLFSNCAASRISGGTGYAIYFGGTSTPGSYQCAAGNVFLLFNGNGGVGLPSTIYAAGGSFPSRANWVVITSIDGRMPIIKGTGANLYVTDVGGYAPINGYAQMPPTTTV